MGRHDCVIRNPRPKSLSVAGQWPPDRQLNKCRRAGVNEPKWVFSGAVGSTGFGWRTPMIVLRRNARVALSPDIVLASEVRRTRRASCARYRPAKRCRSVRSPAAGAPAVFGGAGARSDGRRSAARRRTGSRSRAPRARPKATIAHRSGWPGPTMVIRHAPARRKATSSSSR